MTLPPITFVAESPLPSHIPSYAGPRMLMPFVEEVGRRAGRVPPIIGCLRDALPLDGFILFDSLSHPALALEAYPPAIRAEIAARLVPIGIVDIGERVYSKVLEPFSVAAAIDVISILQWEGSDHNLTEAHGLYGLHAIAALIGAEQESAVSRSERYCYLKSHSHYGLPHLLLDYLSALAESRELN